MELVVAGEVESPRSVVTNCEEISNIRPHGETILHQVLKERFCPPIKSWTGTNQHFLLPNLAMNKESTRGAQRTYRLHFREMSTDGLTFMEKG